MNNLPAYAYLPLGAHGCGDGGGCCRTVESSPICEEETMSILSSLERPVRERSRRRSAPMQHLPPQLPGRTVEDFKRRAVLCPQPDASGPAEPCQVRFWIKRV